MEKERVDTIEVHYPLFAKEAQCDTAYSLYSAIVRHLPEIHDAKWTLGIHTIRGTNSRPGIIQIADGEKLRLRLPVDKVPAVYKLSGARLRVGRYEMRCGLPTIHLLNPTPRIRARLVVVKTAHNWKKIEPDSFLEAIERQLKLLNVSAHVEIERKNGSESDLARRVVKIKNVTIPGYGVILSGLSNEDSLLVQSVGVGGRRRMGCGLFDSISHTNP